MQLKVLLLVVVLCAVALAQDRLHGFPGSRGGRDRIRDRFHRMVLSRSEGRGNRGIVRCRAQCTDEFGPECFGLMGRERYLCVRLANQGVADCIEERCMSYDDNYMAAYQGY